MSDEHDKWFYDLEALAKVVESNRVRHERATKRSIVIAVFVLFAFLVVSYRTEVAQHQININTNRIKVSQERSCQGGIQILRQFNKQQDSLIEVTKTATFLDPVLRARLIKTYEDARILPLPICKPLR